MKSTTEPEAFPAPESSRRAVSAGAFTDRADRADRAPERFRAEEAAAPSKAKRPRRDLRFRLAYTKPELSLVLPFGHTTLEEMIKRGAFPDGMRAHPTAHKIWPRRVIEEWLEKAQGQGAAR